MRPTRVTWMAAIAALLATSLALKGQQPPASGTQGGQPSAEPGRAANQGAAGGRQRLVMPPGFEQFSVAAAGFPEYPAYDATPPELPADLKAGGVLIFSKTNGFRDEAAVQASDAALAALVNSRNIAFYVTENGAVMNADQLSRFRVVIWNNTSGDTLSDKQKGAFKTWLESGGTSVGLHGAGGDPLPSEQPKVFSRPLMSAAVWKWYVDNVVGAQFVGHSAIQPATINIEDKTSPLTKGLPAVWHRSDEWYVFSENPRKKPGFHVIAAVDEKTYDPAKPLYPGQSASELARLSMGADHPSIWWHCVGKGRALYSAIGHGGEMYREPLMLQFLGNAIGWSLSESGRARVATVRQE